jgi:hypothetical protein
MKGAYSGLWFLLTIGFAIFFVMSAFGGIKLGDVELESAQIYAELTKPIEADDVVEQSLVATPEVVAADEPIVEEPRYVVDTMPQRILFVGDSMLEGLSPRLAAYAKHNGHKLHSVIWYGSTTKVWGNSQKLAECIASFKPTFIFVSLGGNEMFVRDIKSRHLQPLKNILEQIGQTPYQWIAPPNWKPDTGINELLAENIPAERLFVSKDLTLARASDKIHPTRTAAYAWFDLIVEWMAENQDYRIKLEKPQIQTAKPDSIEALAPPK